MASENGKKRKFKHFQKPEIKVNWTKELINFIPVFVIVGLFLYGGGNDSFAQFSGLLTSVAISVLAVWFAHFLRGIFFPDMSLLELYNVAKTEPIAAAIVFASIIFILAKLMDMLKIV
jgi:type IV secretory pathway TrbD component